MARVMGICGGLVGPKTENVDFSLVLIVVLKRGGRRARFRSGGGSPGRDLERGKALFRRKKGREEPSRRLRPQGPGGFESGACD